MSKDVLIGSILLQFFQYFTHLIKLFLILLIVNMLFLTNNKAHIRTFNVALKNIQKLVHSGFPVEFSLKLGHICLVKIVSFVIIQIVI